MLVKKVKFAFVIASELLLELNAISYRLTISTAKIPSTEKTDQRTFRQKTTTIAADSARFNRHYRQVILIDHWSARYFRKVAQRLPFVVSSSRIMTMERREAIDGRRAFRAHVSTLPEPPFMRLASRRQRFTDVRKTVIGMSARRPDRPPKGAEEGRSEVRCDRGGKILRGLPGRSGPVPSATSCPDF